MRITRVALSFFSVGLVAGTFEQAAGLGNVQHRRHAPQALVAAASVTPSVGAVEMTIGQPSRGEPVPLTPAMSPAAPQLLTPGPSPMQLSRLLEAGDAGAAEAVAAAFLAPPRLGSIEPDPTKALAGRPAALPEFGPPRPMSRPDGANRSPLAGRSFVAFAQEGMPGGASDAGAATPEGAFSVPPPVRAREFILPIDRGRVTSMFHQGRYHPAIDLAAPLGTPVRATTRKQRVTFAGRRGGYGNLVITRDPSGRQHYYGHLQRIVAGIGSLLEQGDLLGLLGSTGRSTGPHVHYEVRKSTGGHFNPATFLFPGLNVRPGYAWNDGGSSTVAAVRSTPRPQASARVDARRTVRAARKVSRRARVARGARRTRFAGRAPTLRYYRTQRASRQATRIAARYYGYPRPR